MAKNKDVKITITLECIDCAQDSEGKKKGVSIYTTWKNCCNTPI
jgi:ribosomal protein L33